MLVVNIPLDSKILESCTPKMQNFINLFYHNTKQNLGIFEMLFCGYC
ncbi:hypothetical protein T36_1664 [Helicobacter cinaedi]|nr:hypothetical protein [Helicobacter cinaedi]BDB65190.1 hypothetical protein T36_1664 [Helicobacter cinaedi]